nr:immunoglobulin light chain junction region [Macaca mulatta]MOV94273.1 immunoglobulin light chain junction region [Macaca mulatta]MOV94446.1 immunoglobulin light chain junction region [Macaca mulatta]MOV95696.1 immunoglobulin light chain junction region [Macaca mulatta]MOV95816.1 immunoglobulin light chain junction region [Macaca mulatta]
DYYCYSKTTSSTWVF